MHLFHTIRTSASTSPKTKIRLYGGQKGQKTEALHRLQLVRLPPMVATEKCLTNKQAFSICSINQLSFKDFLHRFILFSQKTHCPHCW